MSETSKVRVRGNVVFVLTNVLTGKKIVHQVNNLVTNDGDLYYAQRGAAETPTTDFTAGGLRLGTAAGVTPAKADTDVDTFLAGSGKAVFDGYPKTNDTDADNTGAGTDIVTWKFYYDSAEANAAITEGAIVDSVASPASALTHFTCSETKTDANTLKVFVNHEFLGA